MHINKIENRLYSTDNFLATEGQVHLKPAKCSKNTCGYLNPEESPSHPNALIFNFYWRLSHIMLQFAASHSEEIQREDNFIKLLTKYSTLI